MQKYSNLTWASFSEEGMLIVMNDNGVISGLNFKINQWVPLKDMKTKYQETYKNFWIVGFMENDLLALELPSGLEQPPLKMKSIYKKISL